MDGRQEATYSSRDSKYWFERRGFEKSILVLITCSMVKGERGSRQGENGCSRNERRDTGFKSRKHNILFKKQREVRDNTLALNTRTH